MTAKSPVVLCDERSGINISFRFSYAERGETGILKQIEINAADPL
jgi:hypothetical protein